MTKAKASTSDESALPKVRIYKDGRPIHFENNRCEDCGAPLVTHSGCEREVKEHFTYVPGVKPR